MCIYIEYLIWKSNVPVIPWLSLFLSSKSLPWWGQRTIIPLSANKYHVWSHLSPVTSLHFSLARLTTMFTSPVSRPSNCFKGSKVVWLMVWTGRLTFLSWSGLYFKTSWSLLLPPIILPRKTANGYAYKTPCFKLILAFHRKAPRKFWVCPRLERPNLSHCNQF